VKKLAQLESMKEYAMFCPVGQTLLAEESELMIHAAPHCRQEKSAKLLIDSTSFPGFQPRNADSVAATVEWRLKTK
jgi:hypothetical protein